MIYQFDQWSEKSRELIADNKCNNAWIMLMLTDSYDYQKMCGNNEYGIYTIKISRNQCKDWNLSVCDFIGFYEANGKNAIIIITEEELESAKNSYIGHHYNDSFLRDYEPPVLIHSTPMSNWNLIKQDGMLKSWNKLKAENVITEKQPIGINLGDPVDFSDYIMFGKGVTGEIVVNSKQQGNIVMDENAEYLTGARLYFDAKKMAKDGLLVRDGCHLKVKDTLPLKPYLIWAATFETLGLASQISTPKMYAKQADKQFQRIFHF